MKMNCWFDCVMWQLIIFFLSIVFLETAFLFHGSLNSNFGQLNESTEVDNGQTVLLLNLEQIYLAHGRKLKVLSVVGGERYTFIELKFYC